VHLEWAVLGIGLAVASGAGRQAVPAGGGGPQPPAPPSALPPLPPVLAAPAAKPKAPSAAKPKPRAAGAPKPAPAKRATAKAAPAESGGAPDLMSLRDADRELFPQSAQISPSPVPGEFPRSLLVDSDRPVVRDTGLPPPPRWTESPEPGDQGKDLGWLKGLVMPEITVRWDSRVLRYLDFYRDDPRGRALVANWTKKSGRWAGAMKRALRDQRIPEDLVWVSLVESGFEPTARSPAGAAGLWQLMPETARAWGLVVDKWIDERLDPERSTDAAARYLADLYRKFNGWELALAGYNMGAWGLVGAIRKYNTNDYWQLCKLEAGIPWETTLYVPKIVALAVVAKNPTAFGVDPSRVDPPVMADPVQLPGGTTLKAVASAAGVAVSEIEALNPQIRAGRTPPADSSTRPVVLWTVRVPAGKGADAAQAIQQIKPGDQKAEEPPVPAPAVSVATPAPPAPAPAPVEALPVPDKRVVVVPADPTAIAGRKRVFRRIVAGDSLPEVASAFGVTSDDLRRWNALDPAARLHEGMTIQVFVLEGKDLSKVVHLGESDVRPLVVGSDDFYAYFEGLRGRKRTTIIVQPGDTWEKIAKRYGLTLGQLERINHRGRTEKLAPKETLVVYAPIAKQVPRAAPSSAPALTPIAPVDPPAPEGLPPVPEASAARAVGAD
jgi:membrane-bound lytic murein transglycosylase D